MKKVSYSTSRDYNNLPKIKLGDPTDLNNNYKYETGICDNITYIRLCSVAVLCQSLAWRTKLWENPPRIKC